MQLFHQLQIKLLIAFSPARFFHKINSLDWYKKMLHDWADADQDPTHLNILELACETGSLSAYLHAQDHHVTGVDHSSKMIQYAKINHPEIDFYQGDASKLTFNNDEFDIVLAASLINIAPSAQTIVAEMARVCKPEGIIKILVPEKDFDDVKLEQLVNQLGISGFAEVALRTWHKYPPKMSLNDIEVLLEKSGLTVASHQYYLNEMLISVIARN